MWWQQPLLHFLLVVLSAGYQQRVVFSAVGWAIFMAVFIGGSRGIRGHPLDTRTLLLWPLPLLLGNYNMVAREIKMAQNRSKRPENIFLHFRLRCYGKPLVAMETNSRDLKPVDPPGGYNRNPHPRTKNCSSTAPSFPTSDSFHMAIKPCICPNLPNLSALKPGF